ncbi:Chain length determinant protein [Dyadobacter sp. SG02]|uniref:Wzz/FepE/Etk N-terminal domain-containing protein n=1 Tax=Dyadobacter sp. SG02 TaxID=1855291 RepID=UPI0008B4156A|nr:Wzz/FepE/Etk N-terminal domain-containing protein [Dyadobacter sp. SG02]SEJ33302.1 Chain length determinant protein [Dyadobacter sp. SG02]
MISHPEKKPEVGDNKESSFDASEIRFADIILFVGKYIKLMILVAIVSVIAGVAYSFLLPRKYEASVSLLPEYGTSKRGSFSLLGAGLTGDGAEKLQPELYPNIMQSSPFGEYLLKQPVVDQDNKPYKTLLDFLKAQVKPGLLSGLFSSKPEAPKKEIKLQKDGILSYSRQEQSNIASAISLLSSDVDQKSGVIQISAETIDPFVSAIIVEAAQKYLIDYVEDYRSSKAAQREGLLADRVKEAKARLRTAEYALQSYRDQNRNIFSNTAKIEEQRLQAEYVLSESLYSDLVRRYEQAKVTVKEERPVFKVLEPVKVPLAKSSPRRVRIGLIWGFLGGFFTLLYILLVKEKVVQKIVSGAKE